MGEALWGPMSQEGFKETCRVSTPKFDPLVAAHFLLSACSALTSLECFCRDILVRGAVILSSLELKVSNANFDRFEFSKHLHAICCLVCQSSWLAVCLLLVMAELQIVLVRLVAGLISMIGCWKATPSHLQPQASSSCSLFSCTAHCCFALLIDVLHCTPGAHLWTVVTCAAQSTLPRLSAVLMCFSFTYTGWLHSITVCVWPSSAATVWIWICCVQPTVHC